MEEREELATSEGFEWLYSEDASGSVMDEPPAIGAVTEVGLPLAPQIDAPPTRPRSQGLGRPGSSFDPDDLVPEEFDPAELDASFGPMSPMPAAETTSPVQEPIFEAWVTPAAPKIEEVPEFQAPEAPPASSAPPPPPPPAAPPQIDAPSAPPAMDSMEPPTPDQDPSDTPVAEVYRFEEVEVHEGRMDLWQETETIGLPATTEEATTRMHAVAVPPGLNPTASSRGDIIAEGPRKLSIKERLTPEIKLPKSRSVETPSHSGPARGTKPLVAFLVIALSLGGTLWRMEGLRERIFGGGAPSSQAVDEAFGKLRGYGYQPLEQGQQQMLDGIEKMVAEETGRLGLDLDLQIDMRLLTQGGRQAGAVVITSVDPDDMRHPDFEAGFRQGLSGGDGMMQPMSLKGHTVFTGRSLQAMGATVVVFFDPDGFIFTVAANAKTASEDVAGQLVKANL